MAEPESHLPRRRPPYGIYAYTAREWDPEINLYYYRARYYDPKVGRFLSEDPVRWVAGANFYTYVHNEPVLLTDPAGLMTNARGQADMANVWVADCWMQMASAWGPFLAQNQRMRDNNTIGVDKYFHCMANCEAADMGPCGRGASHIISYLRELYGMVVDPWTDVNEDMSANSLGRNCCGRSCYDCCKILLPPRLPGGFRR